MSNENNNKDIIEEKDGIRHINSKVKKIKFGLTKAKTYKPYDSLDDLVINVSPVIPPIPPIIVPETSEETEE